LGQKYIKNKIRGVKNNQVEKLINESCSEGSTTENLTSFQVYSTGNFGVLNILVDKIWVNNKRIYFRVRKIITSKDNYLKKERYPNIYSIHQEDVFSIRCRLYF